MDEAEAIRCCQQGERDAFHFLVDRYGKVLYSTAYLITGDAGLSEDLVQEAFLHAWQGMPSFRTGGNFKAWILRILVKQAVTKRRKRRVVEVPVAEGMDLSDPSSDGEELAINEEERQHIWGTLDALPREQREVVVLRYCADLTIPSIARALSCREGTVKSRLHRALVRLRDLSMGASGQPGTREERGAS